MIVNRADALDSLEILLQHVSAEKVLKAILDEMPATKACKLVEQMSHGFSVSTVADDAVYCLLRLGIPRSEGNPLIAKAKAKHPKARTEELVKLAMQMRNEHVD